MTMDWSRRATEFLSLVRTPDLPDLGPSVRVSRQDATELESRVEGFCERCSVQGEVRECLRSAALLWHDHLELSHTLAQGIASSDGSFLHGIMHRREPDYGNAGYWFRRVGDHRTYGVLATAVGEYLEKEGETELARALVPEGRWDALAMVHACAAVARRANRVREAHLREVQRLEFEVLVRVLLGAETSRVPRRGRVGL